MSCLEKKSHHHLDTEKKVENSRPSQEKTLLKWKIANKYSIENADTSEDAHMAGKNFIEGAMNSMDFEPLPKLVSKVPLGKQKSGKSKIVNVLQIFGKVVQSKKWKFNSTDSELSNFNKMEADPVEQADPACSESMFDAEESSSKINNGKIDMDASKVPNNVDEGKLKRPEKRTFFRFRTKDHNIILKKGVVVFKCHICSSTYRQKFSLHRHFCRSHVNSKYLSPADIANCKINVPDELHKQQVVRKDEKSGQAESRKMMKKDNAIVLETNESRVMKGLYKCHECIGKFFDLESELKLHLSSHPDAQRKKFSCDKCSAVFLKKQVLSRHLASHLGKNSENVCKKCGLTFLTKAEYSKHTVMHSTGKKCKYCLKVFSTCANRRRHERIHEGLKSHSCIHCDMRFSQNKDLDRHLRKKHFDLCSVCNLCPKAFLTKSDLKMHVAERHPDASGTKKSSDSAKNAGNVKIIQDALPPPESRPCPICDKIFPNVYAMLKHKSKSHASKKRKRQVKSIRKDSTQKKYLTAAIQDNEFYFNLSSKIADNLINHVDGKAPQLSLKGYNFSDQIELFNFNPERSRLPWSTYNFPNNFDVDYAIQNKGQEVKSKTCDNLSSRDRCLYATGLNKISPPDLIASPVLNGNYSSDSSMDLSDADGFQTDHGYSHSTGDVNFEDRRKKLIGRDVKKVYLCYVCKDSFHSFDSFDVHRINNHPNVDCAFIEIEGEKESPPAVPEELCWQYLNPDGIYFSCSVPPAVSESIEAILKCTKCHSEYRTSHDLHSHIIECGGTDNAPKFRKPIQQKRIKRTMKNRLDLTIKLQPQKKVPDKSQFYKNNRRLTTSMTCNKNYFITTPKKMVKKAYVLKRNSIPIKPKFECFTCCQEFATESKLKNHMCLPTFERKRQSKTASTTLKVVSVSEFHKTGGESNKRLDSVFTSSKDQQPKSDSIADSNPLNESLVSFSPLNKCVSMKSSNEVSFPTGISEKISHASTSKTEALNCSLNDERSSSKSNADHAQAFALHDTPSTEKAVDLCIRPKEQQQMSALAIAMQSVNNYSAENQLKRKKKSTVSSLHETVERLKRKQKAVIDSEMANNGNSLSPAKPDANASFQAEITKISETSLGNSNQVVLSETTKTIPFVDPINKVISTESSNQVTALNTLQALSGESDVNNTCDMEFPKASKDSEVHMSSDTLHKEYKILEVAENELQSKKEDLPPEKVPKLLIKLSSHKIRKGNGNKSSRNSKGIISRSSEKKLQSEINNIPEHHNLIQNSVIPKNSEAPKTDSSDEVSTNTDVGRNMLKNSSEGQPNTEHFASDSFTVGKVPLSEARKLPDISDTIDTILAMPDLSSEKQAEKNENMLTIICPNVNDFPSNKDCSEPRRSSGSHERLSPSLETLVDSIKMKLQSQEPEESADNGPSNGNLSFTVILPNLSDKRSEMNQCAANTSILLNNETENHSASNSLVVETSKNEAAPISSASSFHSSLCFNPTYMTAFPPAAKLESSFPYAETEIKSGDCINTQNEKIHPHVLSSSESSLSDAETKEKHGNNLSNCSVSSVAEAKTEMKSKSSISNTSMSESSSSVSQVGVKNNACELAVNSSLNTVSEAESAINIDVKKNEDKKENSAPLKSQTSQILLKKKGRRKLCSEKRTIESESSASLQKNHSRVHSSSVHLAETVASSSISNDISKSVKPSQEASVPILVPTNDITNAASSGECSNISLTKQDSASEVIPNMDHVNNFAGAECKTSEEKASKTLSTTTNSVQEKNETSTKVVSEESEASQSFTNKLKNKLLLALAEPEGDKRQTKRSSPRTTASEGSRKKVKPGTLEPVGLRSKGNSLGNKTTSKPLSPRKTRLSGPLKLTSEFGKSLANKMREKMKLSAENASYKDSCENQPGPSHHTDIPSNAGSALSNGNLNLVHQPSCENDVTIKSEFEKEDCTKKHSCPYCMLEFAYLTNFRRHIKTCKEKTENMEAEATPSAHSSLLQFLPKKDEVEESMLNLLRHQSRQTQMMKEAEKSSGSQVKGFQTYSCKVCNRIYLSLFKLLQHQVTHKLANPDSRDDATENECKDLEPNMEESPDSDEVMNNSVCDGNMDVKILAQTSQDGLSFPVKAETSVPISEVSLNERIQNSAYTNDLDKCLDIASKQNEVCNERNIVNASQELNIKEVILDNKEKQLTSAPDCMKSERGMSSEMSENNPMSESTTKQGSSINSLKKQNILQNDTNLLAKADSDEKKAIQQMVLSGSAEGGLHTTVASTAIPLEIKSKKKSVSKKFPPNKTAVNKTVKKENGSKDDKKVISLKESQSKTNHVLSNKLKTIKKVSTKRLKIENKKILSKAVKNSVSPKILDVLPVKQNSVCKSDTKPVARRGRPPKLSVENGLKSRETKSSDLKNDKRIKHLPAQPKLKTLGKSLRKSADQKSELPVIVKRRGRPSGKLISAGNSSKLPPSKKVKLSKEKKIEKSPGTSKNLPLSESEETDSEEEGTFAEAGPSSPYPAVDFCKNKARDKRCPICKKKFPARLLRNRHLQLAHRTKPDSINSELESNLESKKSYHVTKVKNRRAFQRQCKKVQLPIPKLKKVTKS
ncbi:uncharacterized protein LOC118205366 [Stegodyphus dumicola]|uniref:uncharacterized protein LOC118205366 n=1 Tax=Stegodyphus dumicola TaxID=202533 RepID=UPI0015B11C01|nr:uncharacterized protein LOC118205366 [Stegodyphus dumicola]